jgi:DNA polymerase-3 subunit delta
VVIEAGDLRRNAPLRLLCERAPKAVAIACYTDDERALGRLIDEEMRTAGLRIAADARAALVPLLGADRRASLSELRKLALYAQGQDCVQLEDIVAVVADASTLAFDPLIDAALAGRTGQVETLFAKACQAGTAPSALLSIALRHVIQMHKASLAVADGTPAAAAVERMIPPVHFSRRPLVEAALKAWTPARLERTMLTVAEAILLARRHSDLAEPIAHRALMEVAAAARRGS